MLYTSGSTGKPKGVLHSVGGWMVHTGTANKFVFDIRPGDVFWCAVGCGRGFWLVLLGLGLGLERALAVWR